MRVLSLILRHQLPRCAAVLVALQTACTGADGNQQLPVLSVYAKDFAFNAPDTFPAGLAVVEMINRGPSTHHVQLYRVPDSLSPQQALANLPDHEPLPSYLIPVGGPEGADDPTRSVRAILPFHPGSYLLLCRFSTGGQLHYTLGMARGLVIPGATEDSNRALPPARDTILLRDFSFGIADSILAGLDTFLVVNRGPHEHQVAIARLLPHRTLEDVVREFSIEDAPSATEILGGIAGLGVGEANLLPIDLAPGQYVLLCLVDDPATGRIHVALGMVREFTVYAVPSAGAT